MSYVQCRLCDCRFHPQHDPGFCLTDRKLLETTSLPEILCADCANWMNKNFEYLQRTYPRLTMPGHRVEMQEKLRVMRHADRSMEETKMVRKDGVSFMNIPGGDMGNE
jgi:hypothetical protein